MNLAWLPPEPTRVSLHAVGWFSRFRKTDAPLGRVLVVSQGLEAFGQREIALAVRLRPNESADELRTALEQLVATVRRLAEQGQLVEPGDVTEFAGPGFLDSDVHGIAWAECPGIDPEIPDTALLGILLGTDELALAKSTSVGRVLARLGEGGEGVSVPGDLRARSN